MSATYSGSRNAPRKQLTPEQIQARILATVILIALFFALVQPWIVGGVR